LSGVSEIVEVVDGVLVYCIEPLTVFDIKGVIVMRVVPDKVVLADIVFELDTDPEKLLVPVDVFDKEELLV